MLQDLAFLRRLYPRLQVWFDWFNTTQVSGGLGTSGQWVCFGGMGQFISFRTVAMGDVSSPLSLSLSLFVILLM